MSTNEFALTVVNPVTITDEILIDSGSPSETNVPENDYAEWSSGTTYAAGDRVILSSTHRIYESLVNSNTGNNPTAYSSTTYWIDVAPTNRWACLDTSVSTQTAQANNITYTFEPGQAIGSIGILNITNGTEINVRMVSPATGSPGIVYENTISLLPLPTSSDWYSFFYSLRVIPTQSILLDLPSYADCILTVEILGGADLAVGVIIIGQIQKFGLGIKYGARVGIQDYSRKEVNEFGDTVLIKRAFAKRANFDLFIEKSEVDKLQNLLTEIRAEPVLWIGSNEYESTTIFGFYKNFDILISYPNHSDCSLEIEGLT